jgi:hypothetical protein
MSEFVNMHNDAIRAEQHGPNSLYRRVALWKGVIMATTPGKQEELI